MKKNSVLSIVLMMAMMLSMAACGSASAAAASAATAAPAATDTPQYAPAPTDAPAASSGSFTKAAEDIDAQLTLINSKLDKLLQKGGELPWYYTVTDLDHDGCLEFIAASQHPQDRSTNLKIWRVSNDKSTLTECKVDKDPDESFPDIMTNSTDTFYDKQTDTWYYLFYDNVILSDTEVYTSKSAFMLKNGAISYNAYAVEHTVVENGKRQVSYTDANGNTITADQYNSAGTSAFAGKDRSNTSFDWFTEKQATGLQRLVDSFMVFMGMKKATVEFPVPQPKAMQYPEASPAPSAAPVPFPSSAPYPTVAPQPVPTPVPQPTYLMITKNPTNENKRVGETALFVACANVFDSLDWTMVSPDGRSYSAQQFASMFADAPVSGYYGTTLSIGNVAWDMNGWGAYCTFYYQGQTARSSTAYIYVKSDPTPPSPHSGTSYGTVENWTYATVTMSCSDFGDISASWDVVDVDGDICIGAPATINWVQDGSNIRVTYCHIDGSSQPWVGPVKGTMSGTAHEGGGGYAIDLQNGTQVYVDAYNCNVIGNFYDGCNALVYYYNYPSTENVYQADIYGHMGLLTPSDDDDQGGWAGSHYYDSMPETGNFVGTNYGDMPTHDGYNDDGSTYEAFWCPNCGAEVSLAMGSCPVCGLSFY